MVPMTYNLLLSSRLARPMIMPCLMCSVLAACVGAEPNGAEPSEDSTPQSERPAQRGKGDLIGEDERVERFELDQVGEEERFARASAALVINTNTNLYQDGSLMFTSSVQTIGQRFGLCEDERFVEQPMLARCSATLVAPDLVLTAGHCVGLGHEQLRDTTAMCRRLNVIFDLGYLQDYDDPLEPLSRVLPENAYECERVEAWGYPEDRSAPSDDWALIRLDRAVEGRTPMRLADTSPASGSSLTIIGHPLGLPQKVSRGDVLTQTPRLFAHDADTLTGSSGSGTFDLEAGALVGVHVSGTTQRDLVMDTSRGCTTVSSCRADAGCAEANSATSTAVVIATLANLRPDLLNEMSILTLP
jgi:V8-like Glu-specific endopeptidase